MTACPVVRLWAFFEGRNFRTDFGILEMSESIGFYQSKQFWAEKSQNTYLPLLFFFCQNEDFPDKRLDNSLGLKCGKNHHLVRKKKNHTLSDTRAFNIKRAKPDRTEHFGASFVWTIFALCVVATHRAFEAH